MLSMTGYGCAETLTDSYLMTVEVKTYNNRFLEISHAIPNSLSRFEQAMDARIKRVAARGHVELNVRLRQLNADFDLRVDEKAVRRYQEAFDRIISLSGLREGPVLRDYLTAEGVLVTMRDTDASCLEEPLMALLDQALADLLAAKQREGEATRRDLVKLGEQLRKGLEAVESHAGTLEQRLRDSLIAKFDELLGNKGFDETRFLQEVAILLSKYSVNEEIVRLRTHIEAFGALLDTPGPVGRRLDFLSQEMNREINTIGSKSIVVEISQEVISLKDSLENIREQVRNIE